MKTTGNIGVGWEPVKGFRLSPQQARLWELQKQDGQIAYRSSCAIRVDGAVDWRTLQKALDDAAARHEILRTTLVSLPNADMPVQVIHSLASVAGRYEPPICETTQQKIDWYYDQSLHTDLDIEQGPWRFVQFLSLSATRHALLLSYPSFCADATSLTNLVGEIADACAVPAAGTPGGAPQYADIAEVFHELLTGTEAQIVRKHWKPQDLNSAGTSLLPFERTNPAKQRFEPGIVRHEVESDLLLRISQISSSLNCHPSHFVLACWWVLLCRVMGEGQGTIGVSCDGRSYDGLLRSLGPYTRFLPFSVSSETHLPFSSVVTETAATLRKICEWQDYFSWEYLNIPVTATKAAFFPACFEFFDLPSFASNGVTFSMENLYSCVDRFKIKLSCHSKPGGGSLELYYDSRVTDQRNMERLVRQLRALLESAVMSPDASSGRLNILCPAEREELISSFNATAVLYSQELLIHDLIEEQARETPDATAVLYEERQLTYSQLDARANQLARWLQKHGIGPDAKVGVCLERGLEMMIAILGVLKAGGCFVPFDPSHARERLGYMLADAQVDVLIAERKVSETLGYGGPTVALDTEWSRVAEESAESLRVTLDLNNLIYLIYTSGSTGKPKGVLNVHGGCLNRLLWMQQRYKLSSSDRVLQKTPLTFDVSVWELLWPLMAGAQIVLAQPGGHRDPDYLIETIQRFQITTIHFVPAMLESLLLNEEVRKCASLKRVICSGEALGIELQRRFQAILKAELHNLYGPTEASIDVTSWQCSDGSSRDYVPIGTPIANTGIYLLDSELTPVPIWHIGEIFIGGIGIARGYQGRPDLTAERFLPEPFSGRPGARMYKSSDLARNGLEAGVRYIGRIDSQFKIRGFRVEAGEIETVFCQHSSVREAVLVVSGDASSDKRLTAYITQKHGQFVAGAELFSFLEQRLPEYMLPSTIILLDHLPLTANGKIDRQQLPLLMGTVLENRKELVPPRSTTEKILADIWRNLLGCRPVGLNDSFFDLGGHSLIITKLLTRVANEFNVSLTINTVLQSPSLGALAGTIDDVLAQRTQEGGEEDTGCQSCGT
jgi:amino acid adenylation domain-containing protein